MPVWTHCSETSNGGRHVTAQWLCGSLWAVLNAEGGQDLEAHAPGDSSSGILATVPCLYFFPCGCLGEWGEVAYVRAHLCVKIHLPFTPQPFTGHLLGRGCIVRNAEKVWQGL